MKASSKWETGGQQRLNVMRFLVCADAEARLAADRFDVQGEWHEILNLCQRWKLLAALESRLTALDIRPPEAEEAELSLRTRPAVVQTMLCIRAGAVALAALQQAGIPCAGFKGVAALAYLYPGIRSRTLQDTDVLVRPQDVEASLIALEAAGFKRSPDCPWEEYVAFLRNSPGTAGNEAVSLRDEKGGAVDLHWHLGALDIETLLASASPVTLLGRPMPLMQASHAMLLSVHHALRNDFVPADIARDVCDFAHWQPLLTRAESWRTLARDAARWRLTAACAALALIVAELQGSADAEPPLPLGRGDAVAARHIADLYFCQLRNGPFNTDLAYLTSRRPLLQIASGLASGWKRYRGLMQISEQSNGELSLPLRERLWNLGKAAAGLSPRGWRQVRALARAKDRIARP